MDHSQTRTLSLMDLPEHILSKIYYFTDLVRICPCDLALDPRPSPKAYFPGDDPRSNWGAPGSWGGPSCTYRVRRMGLPVYGSHEESACYEPFSIALLLVSRKVYNGALAVLYSRNKFRLRTTTSSILTTLLSIGPTALSNVTSLHIVLKDEGWEVASRVTILSEWKQTCEHLAHLVSPRRLSFAFTCDFFPDDQNILPAIAASLAVLPTMKSCAISLGWSLRADLETLAKNTALTLSGYRPESGATSAYPSLLDLPREVRSLILENTDLVAWRHHPQLDAKELLITNGRLERYTSCCGCCNDTLDPCSCKTQAGTYSLLCECFTGPITALLRVNRQLYSEALEVLFAHNRFRFSGRLDDTYHVLCQFPPQALPLLRTLDFHFSMNHIINWNSDDTVFRENWQTILLFIKRNLNLPYLWLSISIGGCDDDYMLDEPGGLPSSLVIASHRGILKPVEQLKGLGRFWVFMKELCQMEDMAEKEVMGVEYDSTKEGKLPPHARSFASPHERWRNPEPVEGRDFIDCRDGWEDGGGDW